MTDATNAMNAAALKMMALPMKEMDHMQTQAFMACNLLEATKDRGAARFFETGTEDQPLYRMLVKYLAVMAPTLKVTKAVMAFVATALFDHPSTVGLWTAVLAYLGRDGKEVNMEAFTQAFPHGYPTEQALHGLHEELKAAAELATQKAYG